MNEKKISYDEDLGSRKRIVSEIKQNFFVEASAGSGKTTMLVERMVAMVEGGLDISKICTITFTKAAAGEFYDRFQELLDRRSKAASEESDDESSALPPPTDETRKRCRDALQNIDLCFMGTIDAFCKMILSEHPSEAKIPSDARIVPDADADKVYRQQFVKIGRGDYGSELKRMAGKFKLFHSNPKDVFVHGIKFIMDRRNAEFQCFDIVEDDLDKNEELQKERRKLVRVVEFLVNHRDDVKYEGVKNNEKAWKDIEKILKRISEPWNSKNYDSLIGVLRQLNNIRLKKEAKGNCCEIHDVWDEFFKEYVAGKPGKKKKGKEEDKELKWYEMSGANPIVHLCELLENHRYHASMTFLVKCVPLIENAMRKKGYFGFFDNLFCLREMLKRDAAAGGGLIRYIFDRHSYFLIDEFQDTNPLQAEVLFYLTAREPKQKWSDCVPMPGSLFIVGDPKQSIYRFRGADVASFMKVKKLFEKNGGEILHLPRNFRSKRDLCEYYNHVFPNILSEKPGIQSGFEAIPLPDPPEDEFQGVYTYELHCGETDSEMSGPARIAAVIKTLTDNEEFMIRGKGEEKTRRIRYGDFMVITGRKDKDIPPIIEKLQKERIPVRTEGYVPFTKNKALREISQIYAAVADRGDTISAESGAARSFAKSGELDRMRIRANRLSPAALFLEIMDRYRVYEAVPTENMEVLYYSLELLRNAEKTGDVVTLKEGTAYLRQLTEGTSGEERCLSLDDECTGVRIANLHKVKGLEAPIVILAATSDEDFDPDVSLVYGDNDTKGYVFELKRPKLKNCLYFSTSHYADKRDNEREARIAEKERLLYVAATRARNALIIWAADGNTKSQWEPLTKYSPSESRGIPDIFDLIGGVPKKDAADNEPVSASDLYDKAEETSVMNSEKRGDTEMATFKTERPSRRGVKSKTADFQDDERKEETSPDIPDDNETAETGAGGINNRALLGTMTHKLMEILVTSRKTADPQAAVDEIIREFLTPESEEHMDEITEKLLAVADRMKNGGYAQENGLPADILAELDSADKFFCELPFTYKDTTENIVWNGIMDLVYAKDGKWHIVDYKTNADGKGLDEKYQPQLSAYIDAFKATAGCDDVDAHTYHIDI
ncbi:MAG: UvrD-helicase domain-containing protein [Thermoguttaceae bacterium]|nr:UvrD-helicase domain-containing protein [Thermoguttaceae bacterium]